MLNNLSPKEHLHTDLSHKIPLKTKECWRHSPGSFTDYTSTYIFRQRKCPFLLKSTYNHNVKTAVKHYPKENWKVNFKTLVRPKDTRKCLSE